MGIQSTQIISRKHAIDRIIKVSELIYAKEYKNLEDIAYEPYEDIEFFVKSHLSFDYSDIEKWTDGMIEKVLDKPFFRKSIKLNYLIKGYIMAKPIQKVFIENFTKTMLHVYVDDKHLTITNAHKLTKINGVSICQVNLTEMNFTVILNPIYDKMEMIAEVTRFCEQEFYDD